MKGSAKLLATIGFQALAITTETVLKRYRGSFRRLLQRGIKFVKGAGSPDLADLGFQVLMQQTERLAVTVLVGDQEEPLVEPADLAEFRLEMLETYLDGRSGEDPTCLLLIPVLNAEPA